MMQVDPESAAFAAVALVDKLCQVLMEKKLLTPAEAGRVAQLAMADLSQLAGPPHQGQRELHCTIRRSRTKPRALTNRL